jgi:glycosyltransferase involved in cell wall biosynthesis
MHVCMLSSERFPQNERLKREAAALGEAGHTITVCARGASGEPDREIIEGVDVRRIPDESLYTGITGKLDGARYALRLVQPAWVRAVSEVDDERAVDVCCVQDLPLVKTGRRIGNDLDIPILCDLLGNPTATARAAAESRGGRLRQLARRVFLPPWRLNRLEKSLPDADRFVTTHEEARARYVRETGVDPRCMAVVRDTADATLDYSTSDRAREMDFALEDSFVVTAFTDSRRTLETLVEAAARAADSAVDLQLVCVADIDQETLDDLETLARRRLAGGRVTFRTDTDHPTEYLAMSDTCVFAPDSQTAETAIPMVFDAMAMGVPVVVTDIVPLSRIITRTNAGRAVPIEDTGELSEALVALDDPETAAELGANGRRAVEREYNWERDADRLRAVYDSLENELPTEVRTVPQAGS